MEAARLLKSEDWPPPICIAVHGLFADNADLLLDQAGARVVTANSVPHRSNAIELQPLVAEALKDLTVPGLSKHG
jgi:ribose-phosphate pyrophosphokinase